MTTIRQAFINALLADAAYVDVNPGMDGEKLTDAFSKRMPPTLTAYIAAIFEVAVMGNPGYESQRWRHGDWIESAANQINWRQAA